MSQAIEFMKGNFVFSLSMEDEEELYYTQLEFLEHLITRCEGKVAKSVTGKTTAVIVSDGEYKNNAKIAKVKELQAQGNPIVLITKSEFFETLKKRDTELYGEKGAQTLQQYFCIFENNGVTLGEYMGTEAVITVPDMIGEVPVVGLTEECFKGWGMTCERACACLTRVTILENIIALPDDCFSDCYDLTDVYLPASIDSIGNRCFNECDDITIHAPAGSYAEQYAKENNIPFVAE